MSEALTTYLNDRLAGANIAIQSLEAMRDRHDDQKFRQFANTLLPEILADDRTLRSIVVTMHASPSVVKEAGGWILEKLSRVKLGHTGSTDFEMFESLELLAVGIQGKMCLWKALRAASEMDVRLCGYDFEELCVRARQQYERVENERLNLAKALL